MFNSHLLAAKSIPLAVIMIRPLRMNIQKHLANCSIIEKDSS